MAARKKTPAFEETLTRLEKIVEKLEDGKVSLDESIKLFEEGRKLGRDCAAQLAEVEKKARILLEAEDGSVAAEPFEAEESRSSDTDGANATE
jgi:exodeoxyribonuclease VII small subunit